MKKKRILSMLFSTMVISLILSHLIPCSLTTLAENRGLFYTDVTVENYYYEKQPVISVAWDDDWFFEPSVEFNPELAKTSTVLSAAAYGKEETVNVLEDLGFEFVFQHYPVSTPDDNDTVSYTIGHKYISDGQNSKCLVCVIVMYTIDYEWYSNFNVGSQEDHLGFSIATRSLYTRICDYLAEHGIKEEDLGIYVTGHSRGAAVANLLSVKLIEGDTLAPVDKSKVYCYTSGTPTVSKNGKTEGYESIFNIVNVEDVITRVPLSQWGFRRYGTDIVLPSRSFFDSMVFEDEYSKMKDSYRKITGEDYNGFEGCRNVDRALNNLSLGAPDQVEYSRMFEELRGLLSFEDIKSALTSPNSTAPIGEMFDLLLKLPRQFINVGLFLTEENKKIVSCHSNTSYYCWLDVLAESDLTFGENKAEFWRLSFKGAVDMDILDRNKNLLFSMKNNKVSAGAFAVYSERDNFSIDIPSGQYYEIIVDSHEGKIEYLVEQITMSQGEVDTLNKVKFGPLAIIEGVGGRIILGANFEQPEKSLWALDDKGKPLKYYSTSPFNPIPSEEDSIESVPRPPVIENNGGLPVFVIIGGGFFVTVILGVWYRIKENKKQA